MKSHVQRIIPWFLGMSLGFLLVKNSVAQEEIFSLGMQLGMGTRAIAMGGAYTSLGGDYSASWWNPAGLADIKRIEAFGSMSHLMRDNTTDVLNGFDSSGNFVQPAPFDPTVRENDANFTKLNDIGLAYPVPTIRGSLVFSFGFNRVKSYDSNFDFRAFNQAENDMVNQAWKEIERGGLNTWTLGGAVDVSPNMSVGLGLNFWTGGTDFQSTFREVDINDIYTFDRFTLEDNLNTDVTGFNMKLGAIYRMENLMRFGATIGTPVTFHVDENFSSSGEQIDDGGILNEDGSFSDEGVDEYKIQSPWSFSGGASVNLLNFVLSGDVEYNDWTQIRYKSDSLFAGLSKNDANRLIQDNYRATTRIRLGAEFTLPLTGVSFRAGYFKDPSIFQNADSDEDKQFLSGGLGFLLDKQVKLDVAYVHGFWKRFTTGLPETDKARDVVEDIKVNQVFATLAFRF